MDWTGKYEPGPRSEIPIRDIGGTHERCGTPVTPLQLLILNGL